jgi:hypothetical protein
MVVPCAAWLYCAWQVPLFRPGAWEGSDGTSFRLVEVKACLGPTAILTTHGSVRGTRGLLSSLLPDGSDLIRERPGNLLVTLVERIDDAYVSMHEELAVRSNDTPERRPRWGQQKRNAAATKLLRYVHTHRDAVEKLTVRGRRWLNTAEVERLQIVARRLAGLGPDPSPRGDGSATV